MEAGDQVPNVHYEGIGYSKIDAAVTAESIDLVISSVSPTSASPDGGASITVTGTGFPKDAASIAKYNGAFQLGGVAVTPTVISNT